MGTKRLRQVIRTLCCLSEYSLGDRFQTGRVSGAMPTGPFLLSDLRFNRVTVALGRFTVRLWKIQIVHSRVSLAVWSYCFIT